MNKAIRLLLMVVLCESAGLLGSIVTFPSITTWYKMLVKPSFTPPGWLFGPVWTLLYLLMAISLYLVWGKKKVTLRWFWTQLFFNTLWSFVFFGLKNPGGAFVVIVILWVSIIMTIVSFWKVQKIAAYLQLPYLAWVSFATVLNLSISILNR